MSVKPILVILLITLSLTACKKERIVRNESSDPLIGEWRSGTINFSIYNYDNIAAPFCVTRAADSLHIRLLPTVDLAYRIVDISRDRLKVTENGRVLTFTKAR